VRPRTLTLVTLLTLSFAMPVGAQQPVRVAVTGAVKKQGLFCVANGTTVSGAIDLAGGRTDKAGPTASILHTKRTGDCSTWASRDSMEDPLPTMSTVVLADPNGDPVVESGDIIIVNELAEDVRVSPSYVELSGAVIRPDLMPMEQGMTLTKALARAGGLCASATSHVVYIVRMGALGKEKISVVLDDVQSGKVADPILVSDDEIFVPGMPCNLPSFPIRIFHDPPLPPRPWEKPKPPADIDTR
jgi:protein involved in polysaccharide export with SLBB domain